MNEDIYIDNNATTRLLPPVKEEIEHIIHTTYGNPSSPHSQAQFGKKLITEARGVIAGFIDAYPENILFTSCASESNSTVIQSVIRGNRFKGNTVVTSEVEHSSVRNNVVFLERNGYKAVYLPVDNSGFVDIRRLKRVLEENEVALLSINWAHNETGVIQPLREIVELAHHYGALVHTDAAQLVGRKKISVQEYDIDFLSFTGHKLHAPKGIGVLYAKELNKLAPLIIGGEQEQGIRGGTENILGIGALKKAVEERLNNFESSIYQLKKLRDSFEGQVLSRIPDVKINGDIKKRTPNTSNLMFRGIDGRALVARLDMEGVICSQTSACTSQIPEPSPALTAMGLSEEEAFASIRFSFGVDNEFDQINTVVGAIESVVSSLRRFNYDVFS